MTRSSPVVVRAKTKQWSPAATSRRRRRRHPAGNRKRRRPAGRPRRRDFPSIGGDSGGGIQEARIAMRHGEVARAVEILKRSDGPDALELLGVAFIRRTNEPDEAKEVYNEYSGALRVRSGGWERQIAPGRDRNGAGRAFGNLQGRAESSAAVSPRDTSYWTVSGSASEFSIRDDSFEVVRVPDAAAQSQRRRRRPPGAQQCADVEPRPLRRMGQRRIYKSKFRFSGTEEHQLYPRRRGRHYQHRRAFSRYHHQGLGHDGPRGGQTQSSDGVLGRFDGVWASSQGAPPGCASMDSAARRLRLRRDERYKDDKYFYGASVDFGPVLGGFDASLFAIDIGALVSSTARRSAAICAMSI